MVTVMEGRDTFKGEETVLVVEDEDVVRNLSERVLNKYGYNTVSDPVLDVILNNTDKLSLPVLSGQ